MRCVSDVRYLNAKLKKNEDEKDCQKYLDNDLEHKMTDHCTAATFSDQMQSPMFYRRLENMKTLHESIQYLLSNLEKDRGNLPAPDPVWYPDYALGGGLFYLEKDRGNLPAPDPVWYP